MDGILRAVDGDPGRQEAYLPSPCVQNHAAFLAELADGELGCAWFGGTMEGMSDISIYFSRLPEGADRWDNPVRLTANPDRSEQNPVLGHGSDGRLRLFYTSQQLGNQDQATIETCVSNDEGRSFGAPQLLAAAAGTFIRQPPVHNRSGDWLLPVFRCVTRPGIKWRGDFDTSGVLISRNGGGSWESIDVPDSLGAVHMNIVPLDGNDMLAFFRDRFAEHIKSSRSHDGGLHWSAPESTGLPNNNSSIHAKRLTSGRLVLVYNHTNAAMSDQRRASLYEEIGEHDDGVDASAAARRAVWGVPRAPLVAALSEDGGRTFPFRRALETGPGTCLSNNSENGVNREFSYPMISQRRDGPIDIAFTYYRRAIKHVRVGEAWIMDPAVQFAPPSEESGT